MTTKYLFVAKQKTKTYSFATDAETGQRVAAYIRELRCDNSETSELEEMQCMEALFDWISRGQKPRVNSDTLAPFCTCWWTLSTDADLNTLADGRYEILHVQMYDEE